MKYIIVLTCHPPFPNRDSWEDQLPHKFSTKEAAEAMLEKFVHEDLVALQSGDSANRYEFSVTYGDGHNAVIWRKPLMASPHASEPRPVTEYDVVEVNKKEVLV